MAINFKQFESYVESIDKDSFANDDERLRAVHLTRALFSRLETPYENIIRRAWSEAPLDAALKIASDISLFEALAKNGGKATSAKDLAAATRVNYDVVRRVSKHLGSMLVIKEVGEDIYQPSDFSNSLVQPDRKAIIKHLSNGYNLGLRALPEWLAKNNYSPPTSVKDAAWQLGTGEDLTFWEYFAKYPKIGSDFNLAMQCVESGLKSAIELYPAQERLVEGFKGGVLIVDVGGGIGHDLRRWHQKCGVQDARYVLQDLENVLANADVKPPLEVMAQDFFAPQKVKEPRAFFMKQIMHDWPDDKATEILANLRSAMKPGYTKALIHDIVVPPTNAETYTTGIDLTMMSLFGARERTLGDWKRLIEAADLEFENIYSKRGYRESLIEIVRND